MSDVQDDPTTQNTVDTRNAITLKKGVKVAIYVGANALTFRVRLMGSMNGADTDVYVDGQKAATLTQHNSNVIVNGTKIELINQRAQDQVADYFPV